MARAAQSNSSTMEVPKFMRVKEVAELLDVSENRAYKIMRQLKQSEIIGMMSTIIDHLAVVVMQHSAIDDADLELMKQAALMQEEIEH